MRAWDQPRPLFLKVYTEVGWKPGTSIRSHPCLHATEPSTAGPKTQPPLLSSFWLAVTINTFGDVRISTCETSINNSLIRSCSNCGFSSCSREGFSRNLCLDVTKKRQRLPAITSTSPRCPDTRLITLIFISPPKQMAAIFDL